MAADHCVSRYMEILLKSDFLQFKLLSPEQFVKFLSDRGIKLTIKELEYYDKKEIVRPALRLSSPEISLPNERYRFLGRNSFFMHYYYVCGLIELPREGDFKPWEHYKERAIELYYHQYQFVPIRRLLVGNDIVLKPGFFEVEHDYQRLLDREREFLRERIRITQIASKKWWPKVGLLMILQEAYGLYSFGSFILNPEVESNSFFEKWRLWRLTRFVPENIKKTSNLEIEEIREWYNLLCHLGYDTDPLSEWFVLQQIISNAKKNKLTDKALIAQEYYKLARMVALFIYDLTKEKMPDPDDQMDGSGGTWKSEIYGEPFDYNNKQSQKRILDNYLIRRPYRIALVYEGDTENFVIRSIFDALDVDHDNSGIFLHNAEGQGNIQQYVNSFAPLAKADEIDIFLILDRDMNWQRIIEDFKRQRFIKDNMYHIWQRDFESDNFEIGRVIDTVNTMLKEKNQKEIKKEEVIQKLSNPSIGLMKAVSDVVWDVNESKLSDLVSKVDLAKKLIEPRIAEIRIERDNKAWKPILPIEQQLYKIFDIIPRVIG